MGEKLVGANFYAFCNYEMIMMMLLMMIMNHDDADEDGEDHEKCQMLVASSSTGILSLGGQH